MPQLSRLGALRLVDARLWKREIREAMKQSNGRVSDAAEILQVSERQLFRWLAEPELQGIERAEYGLPRDGIRGRRAVVEEIPTRSQHKREKAAR